MRDWKEKIDFRFKEAYSWSASAPHESNIIGLEF
jgi:hypothetical protein